MKRYWDLLIDEIRKPIEALKITLIFLIQFLALLCLRLVLWLAFFLLPMIFLFLALFHLATNQAKKGLDHGYVIRNPAVGAVNPLENIRSKVFSLQSIDEDLQFWLAQLERLKH